MSNRNKRKPGSIRPHATQIGSLMDRAIECLMSKDEWTPYEIQKAMIGLCGDKKRASNLSGEMTGRGFVERTIRVTDLAKNRKRLS